MQSEGDRGPYLADAVMLTGQPEYFADIVMKRLSRGISDSWECLQMTNFLVCLYCDCDGLQEKIYSFFDGLYIKEISRRSGKSFKYAAWHDGFEALCISLVDIDKTYFERIVNDVGRIIKDHPKSNRFSLDWFYSHCTEGGKKPGRLKKADPEYARIFTEKFDVDWKTVHRNAPTLDEILSGDNGDVLEKSEIIRSVRFRRAARTAGEDELRRLAEQAAAEQDELKKCGMLSAFEERPFPGGLPAVMEMYREGGERLREKCLEMAEQFPGEETAAFALGEARRENNPLPVRNAALCAYAAASPAVDVDIFVSLTEKQDPLEQPQDRNVLLHSLNMEFRHRSDKCSRRYEVLRRYFYNNLRCTYCRKGIVRLMVKACDDCADVLDECLQDCSMELRSYARRVLDRRRKK